MMKIKIILSVLILLASSLVMAATDENDSAENDAYWAWAQELWDSLDRKTGEIKLPGAHVTLNVSQDFYYLNALDAEKVLVNEDSHPHPNCK